MRGALMFFEIRRLLFYRFFHSTPSSWVVRSSEGNKLRWTDQCISAEWASCEMIYSCFSTRFRSQFSQNSFHDPQWNVFQFISWTRSVLSLLEPCSLYCSFRMVAKVQFNAQWTDTDDQEQLHASQIRYHDKCTAPEPYLWKRIERGGGGGRFRFIFVCAYRKMWEYAPTTEIM